MRDVEAVFFDVGETLVDETRSWSVWAEVLGIDTLTLFGVLGAVIERRLDHREVFRIVRPDVELGVASRWAVARGIVFRPEDLYPDAVPCLRRLHECGRFVGIVGNMGPEMEEAVRAMDLPVDLVASSAAWGVEKPSPDFFARLATEAGRPTARVAYVGDRVDNDVVPAAEAGLQAVFLRRGPWGLLQATWPEAARATLVADSLDAVAEACCGPG